MKASKYLTIDQKNFQWGIYTKWKIKFQFPYNFEMFLTHQFKINFK